MPVPANTWKFDRLPILQGPETVTSHFGMRIHPVRKRPEGHKGIDFGIPTGSQILAPADGIVVAVKSHTDGNGAGNRIHVNHKIAGFQVTTRYFHLSQMLVKEGTKVKAGDLLALSGGARGDPGAGTSTGPHLHFEVLVDGDHVDPALHLPGVTPRRVAANALPVIVTVIGTYLLYRLLSRG